MISPYHQSWLHQHSQHVRHVWQGKPRHMFDKPSCAAAVAYAAKWPNPAPKTFGYHEIFHALVILASLFHFTAVARLVLAATE